MRVIHQNEEVVRQQLLSKLEDLGQRNNREELVRERASDPWDQMQDRYEMDLTISVINKDWETRKSVERALRLLAEGEYGICEDCDAEINPKRLDAIPWTTICLDCQQDRDSTATFQGKASYRHAV